MIRETLSLPDRGVELGIADFGGEGPLAVISHANGFCASLYEPLARRLRTRFRVLAFDSRGHGRSSAPAPPEPYEWDEFVDDWRAVAAALCDRVGESRVTLGVGHSFGGSCLLAAAAREPDRFVRTALLDPVLIPPPGERAGAFQGEGDHPMAVAARRRTAVFPSREVVRESWARRGVFGDWEPEILERYLQDGFRDRDDGRVELCCPPAVEAAVFQLGPKLDLFTELASLVTPTLWLYAGRGNFPEELVKRAASGSPAVQLERLELGHLMAMTHPDELGDRLLAWDSSAGESSRARPSPERRPHGA